MSTKIYSNECYKKTAVGTPVALFAQKEPELLNRPILLMGGVHGDEPEGVRLAQDMLGFLRSQDQSKLVPWILIPCLNPDGYAKNQRVNSQGVDLNRNYPSKSWSPKFDKDRYFPGKYPGSELEVQLVVELLLKLRPRLVVHCHSWEPCIVATGERALKDAQRLSQNSGYEVRSEIGYPTPGSLSQFGWHDHQIPIICIEEQEHLKNLDEIWPRFEKSMISVFTDMSLRMEV